MILKWFTLLMLVKGILSQNCQLNATHMDRTWVYATKITNTTWDVLHTDYLKERTSLHLICDSQTAGREIFCNRGSLQERTGANPMPTCPRRMKADTVLVKNENSCRRMGGEMYQIRYDLSHGNIIPLYEVCYNRLNEMALYSRHRSYGFNLAASTYRRPKFSRGSVVSRERELSFETVNVYNRFVELLGAGQTFIQDNKTVVLERGHLANSQDFPTYDQMDETFKYVNVVPQFRGSNRYNWKRIENWVHNLAENNTYSVVVTGSFGVLTLAHSVTGAQVPMHLMANSKNTIPLWSYKVVQYKGICHAFITLNNDYNTMSNFNTYICRKVECPRGLQFTAAPGSTIAHCCNYNHFVRYIGLHAALC